LVSFMLVPRKAGHGDLVTLYCDNACLVNLDISNNPVLTYLRCDQQDSSAYAVRKNGKWYISVDDLFGADFADNVTLTTSGSAIENGYVTISSADIPKTLQYNYSVKGTKVSATMDITVSLTTSVALDEDNFPDVSFRTLLSEGFDTDLDGILSYEELGDVTTLSLTNKGISDLSGIEYLTSLTSIDCSSNNLSYLDVSSNTKLKTLTCGSQAIYADAMLLDGKWCVSLESIDVDIEPDNVIAVGNSTVSDGYIILNDSAVPTSLSYNYSVINKYVSSTMAVAVTIVHAYTYADNGDGTHSVKCVNCDYSSNEDHSFADNICSLCGTNYFTDISTCDITIVPTSYVYDGTAKVPVVTVVNSGNQLVENTDYKVTYSKNTNVGTASVLIKGIGKYSGSVTKNFSITKASQTITAKAGSSSIVAGKTTTITASGKGTLSYTSSNTSIATVNSKGKVTALKPGTVTITVKAAGNSSYKAASKTVKIKVILSTGKISSLTNTSKGIKIKWGKVTGASGYYIYRKTSSGKYSKIKTITSGSTVSYTDTEVKSKNGTIYTYKVVPYSGSTKGSFTEKTTVRLTSVTLSSVKNSSSKKATVKWNKTTKVSGYQIQYSTSKTFTSGNKTTKVSGASKTSVKLSGLKKGKTYYVRIRTYKTVNGKAYYSAWSSKKTVKIAK
ncbi:MAG: fibronectin type III domain-containing protein, partial [Lachnospiraceae bacterium]|nr:fibronectin type III domain-containing protein [Lachnospiraceae bacterium]